ncbi:MAG: purine-binding chemotaxis protein CheW [Phycisphaerae bacterium]|nr:purine-binding chemotaxis protein CheW [Phycisphaerae bacterium]
MVSVTSSASETTISTDVRSGKYLTFCLGNEEYGLEILKVREIIGLMPITTVPRTPEYIKGVINLRGKVIPVIDLRLKFCMPEAERTEETCIIVVNLGQVEVGIIVDRVSEVRDIDGKDIDDPPSFGTNVDASFILGMGKSAERVSILLDITKVLGENTPELADLTGNE